MGEVKHDMSLLHDAMPCLRLSRRFDCWINGYNAQSIVHFVSCSLSMSEQYSLRISERMFVTLL